MFILFTLSDSFLVKLKSTKQEGVTMRVAALTLIIILIPLISFAQSEEPDDVWEPLRFLVGSWEGTGEGVSGQSSVEQQFELVLNDQFLRSRSRSEFKPQEKNPDGEIHEDVGYVSYDGSRDKFVLRAFYIEGFVNTYVLSEISEDGNVVTFETESVENAPLGTKAKLVYKAIGDDQIEEKFFVAWPDKEYGCFSTNQLKRK
jgi:hypothetical protein